MGFRTIVVSSHSKLELSLNYLVFKTVDEVKRIFIDEIQTLIIESTAVSISSALLVELVKRKIEVFFCDEKRNPSFELVPFYGDCITTKRINEQFNWSNDIKNRVWQAIVVEKIKKQSEVLSLVSKEASDQILFFAKEVVSGDTSNREGHAAKVYFNRIFGDKFTRGNNDKRNIYLNYGYSLILSQVNRCIISKGYLTQIGIHHKNEFNQFNLSCDLMEPFRPIIDKKILSINEENFKDDLIGLLASVVLIDDQQQTLVNAISIYCSSVFAALNQKDVSLIKFYSFI